MVTNNGCISVLSSYTIIDSVLLYFNLVTVSFIWLVLVVPWDGLQCMIVVSPAHTHLPFCISLK